MIIKKLLSAAISMVMTAGAMVIPQLSASAEVYSYSNANGWTLNAAVDQGDGSLSLAASGSANGPVFTPDLETGKKYVISYDVGGLGDTVSGSWDYPFRVALIDGGASTDIIAWRRSGRWNYGTDDTLVANGSNGTNQIIIDTAAQTYEVYALGSAGKKGSFNSLDGLS
ncbi:MAG: hypothetical protein IJH37_11890, partial [Clostridia bacterium]|nr:hypothetical protein [Clostridia bacterium]